MQPSGLTLDPAANLWSSTSPSNNLFAQSPERTGDASSYGMPGPLFYPQTIGSVMSGSTDVSKSTEQMPNLSATSSTPGNNDNANNSAGEVFMGVQSPQPGGVPSWKWTVMNDKK
jgi:hypothetical protein